jgi:very-short-patch-repair endonuclease
MSLATDNVILDIVKQFGPVTSKEIVELCAKRKISIDKEYVNSVLYGVFREVVVRDRNERNIPTWRLKTKNFEAAKGYESKLFTALEKQKVISSDEAFLDYEVRNPRSRKTYHLDIAIFKHDKKYNIEVDGFDHMRADARLSIQKQIIKIGEHCDIEIDWMDNDRSYVDFKAIDSSLVNKWCNKNLSWCIAYHEELVWPHDITRNIWLIESGWRVMRLWNMQIHNDLENCVKEVNEWINE